jgi:hypothetical protein
MLKVTDAKAVDIKKALTDAGIVVRSIQELYKEKGPEGTEAAESGE